LEEKESFKESKEEKEEEMNESQNLGSTKVKFGRFARPGDKVAIIGTVKEIVSQHDSISVHLSVDDSRGAPIVLSPDLVEVIGSTGG
jgi:hypothetical protein